MKMLPFLALLLAITHAHASGPLTITVEGTHLTSTGTLLLFSQEQELDRVIFKQELTIRPGKITTLPVDISSPLLLQLGTATFVATAGDSIHVSYDTKKQDFVIDGGRFPGNYLLYNRLAALRYPQDHYHRDADNYDAYVQDIDNTSRRALDMIANEQTLSSEARGYLLAYVKYRHLIALTSTHSKTLLALLPATRSTVFPTLTPADFGKDEYAGMMDYIFATVSYIRLLNHGHYAVINYALDSLSGVTREKVLYTQVVINRLQPEKDDRPAFVALVGRIRQLNLDSWFTAGLERRYRQVMMEGAPIDPALLTRAGLLQLDGKAVSLQDIIDRNKGEKFAIRFRENGQETVFSTSQSPDNTANPPCKLINIDFDAAYRHWAYTCQEKGIRDNEYLLTSGFKDALVSYLLLSDHSSTFVLFDASGTLIDADMPMPDILRYHLLAAK